MSFARDLVVVDPVAGTSRWLNQSPCTDGPSYGEDRPGMAVERQPVGWREDELVVVDPEYRCATQLETRTWQATRGAYLLGLQFGTPAFPGMNATRFPDDMWATAMLTADGITALSLSTYDIDPSAAISRIDAQLDTLPTGNRVCTFALPKTPANTSSPRLTWTAR